MKKCDRSLLHLFLIEKSFLSEFLEKKMSFWGDFSIIISPVSSSSADQLLAAFNTFESTWLWNTAKDTVLISNSEKHHMGHINPILLRHGSDVSSAVIEIRRNPSEACGSPVYLITFADIVGNTCLSFIVPISVYSGEIAEGLEAVADSLCIRREKISHQTGEETFTGFPSI